MTSIKAILDRLEVVLAIDAAPLRLRDLIESELTAHFGKSSLQAAEQAERVEQKVADEIAKRQQECERQGTVARLAIAGSGSDRVLGSCHILPTDQPMVAQAKRHRLSAVPLLGRIQNLTPTEFELFGAKVLRALGAQSTYVTRQSNDQGIDFYGVMNVGQLIDKPAPFFRMVHDLEIRFAGQAKNYPLNPIGTNVVRELVGAISLARFKTFSVDEDLFEDLELRPLNPLLALLFTTGRLTAGARELAAKSGIIARSGEQLAVFLADCGIGMSGVGGQTNFDPDTFDDWLYAS